MKKRERIDVSGEGGSLGQNPFGALDAGGLPDRPMEAEAVEAQPEPPKKRGRVNIRREKKGRGGKVVTVVEWEKRLDGDSLRSLAKSLRSHCAVGGTVKNGCVEIQGDQREAAAELLSKEGFRPVFTGG